jgi:hypothetical protein
MHIRLVHWDAGAAAEQASTLRALGHDVDPSPLEPGALRELTRRPPEALVVDLSRLPGQGRDVAVIFRRSKLGRAVPIVFVGGEPAKVERARAVLPDAQFTNWAGIADALEAARMSTPGDPVVPESALAAYAGTPLPRKLGIVEGSRVLVIAGPEGLASLLALPPDRVMVGEHTLSPDLVLAFVQVKSELERTWARATESGVPVWVFWAKRSASSVSGLDQRVVRTYGLEHGWVDHKIARLDDTWAGLRFVERRHGPIA